MKTFACTLGMFALLLTLSSFKTEDQKRSNNSLDVAVSKTLLLGHHRENIEIDPPVAPAPKP